MQSLALRTLAGKSLINFSTPCSRLPERVTLSATHSRSVHARQEEPFDSESAMDAQKKPEAEAGTKTNHSNRDVMADSFGDGYSTRSSDEGFGERYAEHVKYEEIPSQGLQLTDKDAGTQVRQEYDHSQGSEVGEKEMARHATQHTAFSGHKHPSTPGGVGGTST